MIRFVKYGDSRAVSNKSHNAQKMKFSIRNFLNKYEHIFTFTKEIPSGKLHFFYIAPNAVGTWEILTTAYTCFFISN